jgi:hypothetical protein
VKLAAAKIRNGMIAPVGVTVEITVVDDVDVEVNVEVKVADVVEKEVTVAVAVVTLD